MTDQPHRRRVLIVEDEFIIRMMLAETLDDEGYAVAEASSANEALELLAGDAAIELLLTDLNLAGGTDGQALADQARVNRPDLPVVFMTGRPDAVDRQRMGLRDRLIGKPYLPSEIASVVRALLAS